MDERLKESISALMDDEANELEVQRVLARLDDEVLDTWQGYHSIRDGIENAGRDLPTIDIRQSLADKLDYELDSNEFDSADESQINDAAAPVYGSEVQAFATNASAPQVEQIHKKPMTGSIFGIAASAVLALVLATQYQDTLQNSVGQPELVAASGVNTPNPEDTPAGLSNAPLVASVSSNAAAGFETVADNVAEPKIIVQLSGEHAELFNQYLLRHAEHSVYGFSQGVMPLARVASVNSVGF